MPSGSTNYSKTNGERRVVDNASTFIIGDGSDLKVAKVENTASAIGTTENGKLSIDEYVGYNLENVDKLKTAGGSVGVSTSGITSIGVNYSDKKQEGITKNTVIGNVEIGKSSGDEINRDLDTMTEITEDRDFKTNINVESQTINYIKNPEKFKEDLQKAKNEVEDLENAVKNTSNPLGKDKRNVFSNLRAQRWSTSFYNVIGSRVEELARQFKAREINEEDLKEALRDVVKGYGKDIGIDFDVVYLDESTMPKDSKGSTGSSYIVDRKNRKVLIPIDVNKIEDIKKVLGTLTEEVAHGKDALEGRQDKKVAEDKSNDEEGLETLGRPANEYVKKRFGEDNNSEIKLTTDGIDLTNADVGEKVGDSKEIAKIKGLTMGPNETLKFLSMNKKIIENMNEVPTVSDYKNGEAMVKIFEGQENVINKTLAEENYNISSEKVHEELIKLGQIGGQNIIKNKYEGIYVLENEDIRKQFFDKGGNLRLDKFDPKNLRKIENSKKFKEGVEEVRKKSQEYYLKNKNIIKTEAIDKINTVVELAGDTDILTDNDLKFALGKTTITSRIIIDRGVPYLRYNITDKFQDPADINIEWGKPYQMLGPSRIIPLFDVMGLEK